MIWTKMILLLGYSKNLTWNLYGINKKDFSSINIYFCLYNDKSNQNLWTNFHNLKISHPSSSTEEGYISIKKKIWIFEINLLFQKEKFYNTLQNFILITLSTANVEWGFPVLTVLSTKLWNALAPNH